MKEKKFISEKILKVKSSIPDFSAEKKYLTSHTKNTSSTNMSFTKSTTKT
jgi:hypothetical protein